MRILVGSPSTLKNLAVALSMDSDVSAVLGIDSLYMENRIYSNTFGDQDFRQE